MSERSEGQQLVDILVKTASVNAELMTAQLEARQNSQRATEHITSVLSDEQLSAGDILDLVHGTDPNGSLTMERKRFEKANSRPSLLEVAQLAFHTHAKQRVSALVDGREITVTNLNPGAEEPVIKVPVLNLDRAELPLTASGTITDYYSQINHVILESTYPIIERPANDAPITEDDMHAEHVVPIEARSSRTVSVEAVRRVSPYMNEFIPQVAIDIQNPDQAA